MAPQGTLVYHPDCLNCKRFIDGLRRVRGASVTLMHVDSLKPAQRASLRVVPTLVLTDGRVLDGTDAFAWLGQFEANPDSFGGFGALPFSDLDDAIGVGGYAGLGRFGGFAGVSGYGTRQPTD